MSPETALIFVRFAHFGAVALLLGTVLFRRHAALGEVAASLAPRLRRWERWAAALALASAVAWLLAETALAADAWAGAFDPGLVHAILADTVFGNIWCGRLLLAGALAGLAWGAQGRAGGALELGAAGLAFSLGWVGHGVMRSGYEGDLLAAVLGLHVLSAGAWAGALPAVALTVSEAGRTFDLAAAAASLRRFSAAGHAAVAIAVVTGLVTAQTVLMAWTLDFSVPYQQLLAAKIGLVGLMIGIALVNGYWLAPKLSFNQPRTQRQLAALCGLELAVAVIVLALVAAFGNMAPMG